MSHHTHPSPHIKKQFPKSTLSFLEKVSKHTIDEVKIDLKLFNKTYKNGKHIPCSVHTCVGFELFERKKNFCNNITYKIVSKTQHVVHKKDFHIQRHCFTLNKYFLYRIKNYQDLVKYLRINVNFERLLSCCFRLLPFLKLLNLSSSKNIVTIF